MSERPHLTFYLPHKVRKRARNGQHNFFNLIEDIAKNARFSVDFQPARPNDLAAARTSKGYAIQLMTEPVHARALTVRKAYHYPFWAIEDVAARWDWPVARAPFSPADKPKEAEGFFRRWQMRLFGDAPSHATCEGYVYVPLQGRLLSHRSFQTMSPMDMLRVILAHDDRPVVATLHPTEDYSDAELRAVQDLADANARLTVTKGEMERWLQGCDYVATQNSAVAFNGYFFRKPCVLFARIDFHHIAANVADLGAVQAVSQAPDMAPDYAAYVHWFWQEMCINAGRADARERITARLRRAGWPV